MTPDPESVRARFLPLLADSPDPDLALNNLQRLLASPEVTPHLQLLQTDPRLAQILPLLLGSSQFLSDILVRNPAFLQLLSDEEWLIRRRSREEMVRLLRAAVSPAQSSLEMMNCLRREKQSEILRIAAADLTSLLPFESIVEAITVLAEACLQVAVEASLNEFGLPLDRGFCVIGLGKLGGNELNYSSDVDVLFFYHTPEQAADQSSLLFTRACRRIVEILGRTTEEGHVFRVDTRLRPQGETGPLIRSLDSCLAYYEAYGQPWERQALLKARPVAGDMELGNEFIERVTPFIFAKRLDDEAKSHLREIKQRYERRLTQDGTLESDVKQGPGGIRDVEFTVQVLQLLCGAEQPSLRKQGTLPALEALRSAGYLTPDEADALRKAYIFLRTLEHRLQLMSELPLTRVPLRMADLLKVARRTLPQYDKLAGRAAFDSLYDRLTNRVREIHEKVLEVGAPTAPSPSPLGPWSLPEAREDPTLLRQRLAHYGFQNPAAALRLIEVMSRGPGLTSSPAELVGPLLPPILEACYLSADPDQALENFERCSFLSGPKDLFYLTIRDNPSLIRTLGLLGGRSQLLSDILIEHPQFLDILTDRRFLETPAVRAQLLAELSERLDQTEDFQASLNLIRRFKHRELLRIGVRDLEAIADCRLVGQEISDLAEVCLESALHLVLRHLYPGEPQPRLAIFALGKLGGRELHYASDLDLLFVSEGWHDLHQQQRQERVAEEMITALSQVTQEGTAFKVDLRLRPEGKAGALLRSLDGYADYFQRRLDTWERQALIRARPVAGDAAVARLFASLVDQAVFEADFTAQVLEEIVGMRERIFRQKRIAVGASPFDVKNGRGGIVEVEFLVQLLQLDHGHAHPALRTPHTAAAIQALADLSILPRQAAEALLDALDFLKRLEKQLQMAKHRPSSSIPALPSRQNVLARQLGYSDRPPLSARDLLLRDIQRKTNAVRELWDSTVSSLRSQFR